MRRTTIMASDELLRQLRAVAADRGTSVASVIREALEERVRRHRPRPRSLGVGASGHADTARRTGEERPRPRAFR